MTKLTVSWASAQITRVQGPHYAKQRKAALTAKKRAKQAARAKNYKHLAIMCDLRIERLMAEVAQ